MSEKDLTLKEAAKLADDIRSGAVKSGEVLKTFSATLAVLNACRDARTFVGGKALEEAWTTCERGDWMLWLAHEAGVDCKLVVTACVACARTALQYTEDPLVEACLVIVDRWVRGEASIEEVCVGREEAWSAHVDACTTAHATAYATSHAVRAAACATAHAFRAAAYVAAYVADDDATTTAAAAATAAATATAAAYAADDDAVAALKQQADIIRQLISVHVVRAALGGVQ